MTDDGSRKRMNDSFGPFPSLPSLVHIEAVRYIERVDMRFSALIAGLLVMASFGCGDSKTFDSNHPVPNTKAAAKVVKAAEVTDSGGIDDQSFNAAAWAGLKRAE